MRLSVGPSLQQTEITLNPVVRSQPNFQGKLNSLGWWTEPSWSGPNSESGFCAKSISSNGFGAQRWCYAFSERGEWGKKLMGAEFWFLAHGQRKRGPKAGLAGGQPKFWNFNIYHKRDSLYNQSLANFLFYATFWFIAPWEAKGPLGWKSKVKTRGFFYKKDPPLKLNSGNILFIFTFWLGPAPRRCRLIKSPKRGPFPGLLNKSWELGG